MAAQPAPQTGRAERAAVLFRSLSSPATAVLAVALPLVFLHVDLQPKVTLPVGDDGATVALSDLAVLAVVLAAVYSGRTLGFAPLCAGRPVLVAAAVLLVLVAAGTVHPLAGENDYAFADHALTAAKFAEYVLLAAAVPLLVRTRQDLRLVLTVVVLWAGVAAVVAVLQFLGLVNEFEGRRPGQREPSFLGIHDFAALAGAATSVALAWIAVGPVARLGRPIFWTALAGGAVGVVLSGALAGFLGVAAAAAGAAAVARAQRVLDATRVAGLVAVVGIIGAGVLGLRAANIESFLRFLGVEQSAESETFAGESYVQRLALGYIGLRTFADHPVLGIGWQATSEDWSYERYLDDTRRKFPKVPEQSLPSPEHRWGVQNAYLQAAAELGIAGAAAFLAVLVVPMALAWRAARRLRSTAADAALPLLWLLVTMGVWLGLGLVAGIPVAGLQWAAAGLAIAAASWSRADA